MKTKFLVTIVLLIIVLSSCRKAAVTVAEKPGTLANSFFVSAASTYIDISDAEMKILYVQDITK